jgi:hypothetical protein
MPLTFTDDHLLLYIYNELPAQESQVLQYVLQHDAELRQRLELMQSTVAMLDGYMLEPHPSTVEIILEHSDHLEHSH